MWVVNAEGVYIENRPYHSYLKDDILTAINEKYGTNFSRLTYLREPSIAIGDDCPNWNAYEKILLPAKEYFRFNALGSSVYVAGFVQGENAFLNTNSSNEVWNISPEGSLWGVLGTVSSYSAQAKQLLLNEYGKEFDVINAFVENWEQGQTVPNWENYKTLS